MSAIYYYKRRTQPIKWFIIILIIGIVAVFLYWFYTNYFSKIDVFQNDNELNSNKIQNVSDNILINLSALSGDVQMNIGGEGYVPALKNTILHQGDKVKTGANSRAILNLENGSIIRVGDNAEIILQNTSDQNFLIEELRGRVYYNLSAGANYQVKALNVLATALSTKFEVINNADLKYLAVLVLENNVKVEVLDDSNNFIVGSRLDTNEKAIIDLKKPKNEMLSIDTFTAKNLAKEAWYKWNFDLDKGITDVAMTEEPTFQEISNSLQLSTALKEESVYLSWSVYDNTDFKSYQVVRSETNATPKYPNDTVIKTSDDINLNSYLDNKVISNKNYYYRVCVLKTNDNVACGNVASAQLVAVEEDKTPPSATTLSASISESGVALSWTKNQEEDFKEYVILRSAYNMTPTYPADKLTAREIGAENYLDKEVNITSVGAYYYKVCSFDNDGNYNCSNSVAVIDGSIR